ncbi:hypothetical protein [Benzoatithermus flavus]|uniref:Uncharacterized protein n=1 Tax=Benzoatithermus flavus TaxID=3108223 RepID=A0ABU8XUP3_9PROT
MDGSAGAAGWSACDGGMEHPDWFWFADGEAGPTPSGASSSVPDDGDPAVLLDAWVRAVWDELAAYFIEGPPRDAAPFDRSEAERPSTPEWLDEVFDDRRSAAERQDDVDRIARRAAAKAAALIEHLDLPHARDRAAAQAWLSELLTAFPHGASHAAIVRLVHRGCSLQRLQDTAALKRAWNAEPGLWLARRHRSVILMNHRAGPSSLSWRAAAGLVETLEPEEVLDRLRSTWREAWLALAADEPGYRSLIEFALLQADADGSRALHDGLAQAWRMAEPGELADERGWLARLDEDLRRAVAPDGRCRTPFDDDLVIFHRSGVTTRAMEAKR